MSTKSVGRLRTLTVGHDGRGHGAGWHLDTIVVTELQPPGDDDESVDKIVVREVQPPGDDESVERRRRRRRGSRELVFPCGRWLDDHEDDGKTERELLAAGSGRKATVGKSDVCMCLLLAHPLCAKRTRAGHGRF